MWIVRIALQRPSTFIVMALLILIAAPLALLRMPVDILPENNIPVVSIIWNYNGLSAQQMGARVTSVSERALNTTVNDIEHIESQTQSGIAIIKVFFQPSASISTAFAQIVSVAQAQLRQMPPGITPPLVIKDTASSVPVIQLGLSAPSLSESQLFDLSGSFQTAPAFWLDPKNGVVYNLAVQSSQYRVASLGELLNPPDALADGDVVTVAPAPARPGV
jgi:multidrug efflux pump subunit AcrB